MRPQLLLAAFSALVLASCYSPGDGQAPPLQSLYFPTGLTLDTVALNDQQEPKYLYVASSDFDLQYRSSALASYDLDRVRQVVPRNCNTTSDCQGTAGETCDTEPTAQNGYVPSYFCVDTQGEPCGKFLDRSAGDQLLNPGRCRAVDPVTPQDHSPSLIHDTVGIGAFATDVIVRSNVSLDDQGTSVVTQRLLLPVRGDATLHWIDLNDGKFDCGQERESDGSCDDLHRSGDSTADNADELRQPSEPFGIAATADGSYIAVTNQTSGSVSLFVNNWDRKVGPKLSSILGGLPQAPVAITALPKPDELLFPNTPWTPGFLVAYRNAAQVDLLRVNTAGVTENGAVPYSRYALNWAASAPINANSLGFDSRSIVVDAEQRDLDYDDCKKSGGAADVVRNCLLAAHQPDIFVANRAPSSLLVGAMTANAGYLAGSSELPSFSNSVALTPGPSRVVLGNVRVASTDPKHMFERRVFIVCFDSRRIFVYDPKRRVIEAIINTGRGPYALAVDQQRGLAYVAHFTDSYLGVISLDQRFPKTYATIVASLGTPSPPRTSK